MTDNMPNPGQVLTIDDYATPALCDPADWAVKASFSRDIISTYDA